MEKTYTLVTGATSDIGEQICKTLEKSGHYILLTDWNEERICETLQKLDSTKGHRYLQLDLSDLTECREKLCQFIKENNIAVSDVIFAAGIFCIKPIKMIDYDFLKRSFDIGVFSTMLITQVLNDKRINGTNLHSIVFVSSISAKMGTKGYVVYSAVKSSMLGIVKSLAAELSPRVRVNAVLPGGIRTKTTAFLFDGFGINPRYLLGEGEKSDIADLIDFLLSDKSRWITGQEFIIDGGMLCN